MVRRVGVVKAEDSTCDGRTHSNKKSTFISRNRTVNFGPDQLGSPFTSRGNEWDPNTALPQRLVDKCSNRKVSGWSSNLISTPALVGLHAGIPDYSTIL